MDDDAVLARLTYDAILCTVCSNRRLSIDISFKARTTFTALPEAATADSLVAMGAGLW
jgi:hypothetical protein